MTVQDCFNGTDTDPRLHDLRALRNECRQRLDAGVRRTVEDAEVLWCRHTLRPPVSVSPRAWCLKIGSDGG